MRHGETTIALMRIHYELQVRNRKTYSWPTRAKVQKLLNQIYRTKITLWAIDKQYQKLKTVGFMRGYKQPRQRDDGTWYMKPTNWQFTFAGLKYLKNLTGRVKQWLWRWGKKTVGITDKPKDTPRRPADPDRPTWPRSPLNPFHV